jgi:ribosomal protein S18 acetylase RimI-like enzyme
VLVKNRIPLLPIFKKAFPMEIINSTAADIDTIFSLYDAAVAFQKTKFDKHWLAFDREMVEKEIAENRQWKIMDGNQVAGIFAIAYEDPFIWKEKNSDPSVYIHRIVTHPSYRGRHFVKLIIEWAKTHAKSMGKEYIRMDTWGDNEKLIEYYAQCGFTFLGSITPTASNQLPQHYSAIFLSLFEIKLI